MTIGRMAKAIESNIIQRTAIDKEICDLLMLSISIVLTEAESKI
jgi:hypothetical protein